MDSADSTINRYETVPDVAEGRDAARAASRSSRDESSRARSSDAVLKRLYAPVLEPLLRVEELLLGELQSPYERIAKLLRHGTQLGGKRMRPAVHLLMAELLGGASQANVVIGTVLEMVHTATLIHDDVLDSAETRRHVPTINATSGNHTSILLGDYLFAQSFRLASTLDNTRTCLWVGEAARRVCEGELRQIHLRNDFDLDETTYLEVIQGKTAELCRVACALAAAEAGCDPATVETLASYGNSLGIAFQIADDYLDLWGEDHTVGKTLGTDLEQGKLTLPVIRLLETSSPGQREAILATLSGPAELRSRQLRPLLEQSDAKQYTYNAANRFKREAIDALGAMPEVTAKRCLIEIAEFSVSRSF